MLWVHHLCTPNAPTLMWQMRRSPLLPYHFPFWVDENVTPFILPSFDSDDCNNLMEYYYSYYSWDMGT